MEAVIGVKETWFVQALLLRLAASKVSPGDDVAGGYFVRSW